MFLVLLNMRNPDNFNMKSTNLKEKVDEDPEIMVGFFLEGKSVFELKALGIVMGEPADMKPKYTRVVKNSPVLEHYKRRGYLSSLVKSVNQFKIRLEMMYRGCNFVFMQGGSRSVSYDFYER